MLELHLIKALKDNYVYILRDQSTGKTTAIDPGESRPVIEFIEENAYSLDFIWNTHHHHDHIGGNQELKAKYGARIYCSEYDRHRISGSDRGLTDGEEIPLGDSIAKIISVPGHTLGHILFYFEADQVLFSGDTLFSFGCGRLFEGSPEQMHESLKKITKLPNSTKIYSGHEYTLENIRFVESLHHSPELEKLKADRLARLKNTGTSLPSRLEEEKNFNPFIRAKSVEEFARLRQQKDQF